MTAGLTGIVLAGGNSRRLGMDKALLLFDGRTLLEIVTERLSTICDEILIAAGATPKTVRPPLPYRYIHDVVPGQGPLGGLHAGLAAASNEFAFLVACDMPFLNTNLLRYMAHLPRDYQALVPRTSDGWHPAHAIYTRESVPVIEELLLQGRNALEKLLTRLQVRPVPEAEIIRHDPEKLSLFNLNHPQDLATARRVWEKAKPDPQARSA